jgi:hypothetical protein
MQRGGTLTLILMFDVYRCISLAKWEHVYWHVLCGFFAVTRYV